MNNRVCLAVSPGWNRLLGMSPKLWTTLDTTPARKAISQTALKALLKRSNYKLEHAIITSRALFDAYKMSYLTRTCKKLKSLEIRGVGTIGNSLTAALPDATSLETLTVSDKCEIGLGSVQLALRTCQKSIKHAAFLCIKDARSGHVLGRWNRFEALQSISLRSDDGASLDFVSQNCLGWQLPTCNIDCI